MKAFLGTGLLGSGFVRAILKKGEQVQVWNRTAAKAKELEQYGATAFEDAASAVKGASIVHLALKDDASVNEVLQAASSGLAQGTIIVDHTTTSKQGALTDESGFEKTILNSLASAGTMKVFVKGAHMPFTGRLVLVGLPRKPSFISFL